MQTHHPLGQILAEADGTRTIRIERLLNHPIARVWDAITDPAKVGAWLGRMTLDLRLGGHFELHFYDTDVYHMVGRVTELTPPHVLAYGWKAGDMADTPIRWELSEEGADATRIVFTFSNVQSHSAGAAAGWTHSLNMLEEVLAGYRTYPTWHTAVNDALEAAYHQQVAAGVEARCGRPE